MPEISSLIPIQVDLDAGLAVQPLRMTLAAGNANAHQLHFTALRSGVPVDLTGVQVSGACLRADGTTIPLAGAIVNGAAVLTLSAACYAVPGLARLSLTLSYGSVTATHLLALLQVDANTTDLIVDPEGVLPSLAGLLAEIDNMRAATATAEAAANSANQATTNVIAAAVTLITSTAPAIVQSVDGDGIISSTDSTKTILTGVRLYGKTVQTGTPTPEAPIPLANVGAGGSITVKVQGKNLMPSFVGGSGGVASGATVTRNADGTVTLDGTATASGYIYLTTYSSSYDKGIRLPAGTYRVTNGHTGTFDGVSQNITYRVGVYRDGKTIGGTNTFPGNLTIADGDLLECYIRTKEGETYNNLTFKPMICAAGAFTDDYEPYKDGGSMTALAPNGLPGLPVTSGGNYIDSTGRQWVCDEIDYTRKVYVKRVHHAIYDGAIAPYSSAVRDNTIRITLYNNYPRLSDNHVNAVGNMTVQAAVYYDDRVGHSVSNSATSTGWHLSLPKAIVGSLRAWLANNPAEIMYVMATPIETPLAPEELTGSTSLTAQYPNTTAFNDAGAGMKMEYIADTKIYIDQRIAALLNA